MPKQIAIYARVSSQEQAQGFSIDEQIRRGQMYAELHNLASVEIYQDPGFTGTNPNRPAFQQMMSQVKAGQISDIVISRLDRLHRNLGDLQATIASLEKHGVTLHGINENLDTKSAAGRLFVNIMGSFGMYFSEQLSERVVAGHREAQRQGSWTNHAPVGYDLVDGQLVVNEDEAQRVRRAFELAATDASLAEISAATDFSRAYVGYLLRNPAYLGLVYERLADLPRNRPSQLLREREDVHEGRHEALVEDETWDVVQDVRGARSNAGEDATRHPFSGILRCECGAAMELHQAKPGVYTYRCTKRTLHKSQRMVEQTLLAYLDTVREDTETMEEIRQALKDEGAAAHQRVAGRLPQARRKLTEARTARDRWSDAYARGVTDEETFQAHQPKIAADLREAAEELAMLENVEQSVEVQKAEFEEFVETLLEMPLISTLWDYWDQAEKGVLLRSLLLRVTVQKDSLIVQPLQGPAVELNYVETRGRKPSSGAGLGKVGNTSKPTRGLEPLTC